MPSLIDIRRRIRSVKNTQQITKAMKMVAAARLRKAQERVVLARPYAGMLAGLLSNVSAAASGDERISSNPLLAVREEKKVQLVLFTSDRGFAGAFNTNLIKAAQAHIGEQVACEIELYGKKGRDFFRRRDYAISGERIGISEKPVYADAKELAGSLMKRYSDGEVDAVYLLYNEFKSVMSQQVTLKKLLPVVAPGGASQDYLYEQPPAEMLSVLLPRYIELQVYHAMIEGAASQHAARMTAMDAATSNAADVIEKLTLYMNRVRQASITKEIIEVVSGAAALE